MYKTVEATYRNGHFFPTEPLYVTSSDRVLLTVITGGKQTIKPFDEPPITKMPFRPQDYAGILKLVDAEAEIRAMRDEWERF